MRNSAIDLMILQIRHRLQAARQRSRFGKESMMGNATLTPRLMKIHCRAEPSGLSLLEQAMNELHLTARAHDRKIMA